MDDPCPYCGRDPGDGRHLGDQAAVDAAWRLAHRSAQVPQVRRIIDALAATPGGRAELGGWAAWWRALGCPPPWQPGVVLPERARPAGAGG